ncbi:MAG TPA: flagellar basal body L-ring protein FlgH [Bacteroidota bacterium]|nr:flagellar basal body L-ring protein FlgH [Bacteroidota bacterium]
MRHFHTLIGSLSLLVFAAAAANAQDMRENTMRSLFADQKATHLGDAITIIVVETNSASNDASTNSSRESDFSLAGAGSTGSTASPGVNLGLSTSNGFKGQGATSSHGSVQAKLSARVDSVLSNGNLVITGNRIIIINGEKQTISISGVVRPSDIQADNSLYSYNISDARIAFEGDGIVSRAQGPGWVTKLLHWLL